MRHLIFYWSAGFSLLLACSPWPCAARQHERFPENDSPCLHLKSEPAERPIQRLRPVAHERRQWERRELRPVFGITERPSPTLAVAVHEIIPWMAPQWGQTPARYSHPIDFEYFGRTPQFTSSKRRNAWDNSPALSTPLQETIRQRYPSRPASSRNRPVCMVLYPHFQQGTGLTLRIKATLSSVHTSGALSVLVTSHAIDSPAYTGRISMPMIRSPSSMDLSRTILSPPYHSPLQRRLGISGGT